MFKVVTHVHYFFPLMLIFSFILSSFCMSFLLLPPLILHRNVIVKILFWTAWPTDWYTMSPSCHKAAWKPVGRTMFDELQSARRRASSSYHSGLYDSSFTSVLATGSSAPGSSPGQSVLCSLTRQSLYSYNACIHSFTLTVPCFPIRITVYVKTVLDIRECLWEGVCVWGGSDLLSILLRSTSYYGTRS